jgi:hypothetical protein
MVIAAGQHPVNFSEFKVLRDTSPVVEIHSQVETLIEHADLLEHLFSPEDRRLMHLVTFPEL